MLAKVEKERVERAKTQPQRQIKWDDSKMRNVYANVCNVSGSREEIALLFGLNHAWHAGQPEMTIELADRIILNPYMAKRLAILFNNFIRDYEAKYGTLEVGQAETSAGKTVH